MKIELTSEQLDRICSALLVAASSADAKRYHTSAHAYRALYQELDAQYRPRGVG